MPKAAMHPNGTVASPAWQTDDYRISISTNEIEIDGMISLLRGLEAFQQFGQSQDPAQMLGALLDMKAMVAPFITRTDGKPITTEEAEWRAGRLKVSEFGDIFTGINQDETAIPPENADS